MNTTTIYSLNDPISNDVRYVGKTITPIEKRLIRHMSDCYLKTSTHKNNWIKSLKAKAKEQGKPVLQYDLHGSFIKEWESSEAASRGVGITYGGVGIVACVKEKYGTAHGYIWKYKELNTNTNIN